MAGKRKLPPASTPEVRENQLISLAMDLAEEQIRAKTVSASVLSQVIKWASTKERLERDILIQQRNLMAAKTESIRAAKRVDEMYQEAIKAVRRYNGESDRDEYDDYEV